ncbi:hypothetical protein M440DRAFT_1406346 [Trichoderma longibrachiatum ATCC 18648]|uniref:Uncharacterized protein n=1 Tax=Trichoderma longibrachiatum ATCC 18648 TaxID=983965 RepID=A0A2T4BQJ3_TRILO|nr:hypothetical protein M440DRAFT_1406346 [Trichoderma longibrachiatum ATCC 18648]
MNNNTPPHLAAMPTTSEESVRTQAIHDGISALRNDLSEIKQQFNQLSNSLIQPASSEPETQSSSLPDLPSQSPSLYARRIGLANQTEVETAYQRDPADFIVQVKATLHDSLTPFHWDDAESIGRMKRFFSYAGISLDLLKTGDVQDDNFASVARSDLIVRGDMVARHLRAHFWIHERFVLYWTLLEICRVYRIF